MCNMKKFKRKIELEDFEAIQFDGDNVKNISLFLRNVMIEKHGIINKMYNGTGLYNSSILTHLIIVDEIRGNLKVEEGDWVFKSKEGKILVFNDKYVNKNFEQYDNQ
jgi:hypothetical protein